MSSQPGENDLMVVMITYNPGEAYIVAGRLESEGIPASVVQEPAGSALGINIGTLGEVRIIVRAEDYERALAILDDQTPLLEEDIDRIIFDDEQPEE